MWQHKQNFYNLPPGQKAWTASFTGIFFIAYCLHGCSPPATGATFFLPG